MSATGIALIGSGIFAKEEHLPAIRAASSTLSLKAIYSRTLSSAKSLASEAGDLDLYSEDQEGRSYDELLKREDVKAVVIALPILVQPEYIKKALSAGKHVIAEKPIAKDVATAAELIEWYHKNATGPTLSIAENFRFLDSFLYAASEIKSLGRLLGFRMRMHNFVKPGGKYFETAWRKKPEYQGGFLLDGGVHFIAATRLVLGGAGVKGVKTSAFTVQLQEHLPPVDTVDATVQLSNGASGTMSISFGTSFSGSEYAFACEKGTVVVTRGKVVVTRDGKEEAKDFPDEGNGVKPEIAAWGKGLQEGKQDERQTPEEALRDLEVLEAMLASGEKGGASVELKL
ncbi:NAD(P)-binding protein [Massarina eburnea CBS 473.64]|uniref:NAD(P)-binding protein n=1 Tax=Massarina eburnea CBS 473.64 TaxID=1395130 RepID=A0A6A6SH91_9PLEO|nr:NAD(P)-binding protein [Massarina eburnea CBS 473.64]